MKAKFLIHTHSVNTSNLVCSGFVEMILCPMIIYSDVNNYFKIVEYTPNKSSNQMKSLRMISQYII